MYGGSKCVSVCVWGEVGCKYGNFRKKKSIFVTTGTLHENYGHIF